MREVVAYERYWQREVCLYLREERVYSTHIPRLISSHGKSSLPLVSKPDKLRLLRVVS